MPELVRDDQRPAAAGQHPLGLGVDELAAQRVALLRVGRARAPAGPRPWRPPWTVTTRTSPSASHGAAAAMRRGQVVAGAELGQARDREQVIAAGRPRGRAARSDRRSQRNAGPGQLQRPRRDHRRGRRRRRSSAAAPTRTSTPGHVGGVAGVHQPAVEQAARRRGRRSAGRPPRPMVSTPIASQARVGHPAHRAPAHDRRDPDHRRRRVAQRVAHARARRGWRRCTPPGWTARSAPRRRRGSRRGRRAARVASSAPTGGEPVRGQLGLVADPPLLEVDRLARLRAGRRVVDDDVGLDAVVGHRQQRDARAASGGTARR